MKKRLKIHERHFAEQLVFFAVVSFALGVMGTICRAVTNDGLFSMFFNLIVMFCVIPVFTTRVAMDSGSYGKILLAAQLAWFGFFCGGILPDYFAWQTERVRDYTENVFIFGVIVYPVLFSLVLLLHWVCRRFKKPESEKVIYNNPEA